jgi:TetR/AcrR family transcriptional repressor of nem operon
MKVSREHARLNRAHVVEVAGTEFRRHGFDGIGVADLMKAAGLTHGGFYGNFASKDDLAAEASAQAIAETTSVVAGRIAGADDPLAAFVELYLSPEHRDNVAQGCVLAALAPDAARGSPALHQAFEQGVEDYLALLAPLSPGETESARRQAAMATVATAVGALVLSRTVADRALSDAILAAAGDRIRNQR